jgi:hypothetical protein
MITRDRFLKILSASGASLLGLDAVVHAADALSGPRVPWGRLKYVGENNDQEDWHVHPQGDLNLIDSIRGQTTVNVDKKWNVADIANLDSMIQYPFLFMHGEDEPQLDANASNNLREYLMRGGFLFAEDCVNGYGHHGSNRNNDFFFRSMFAQLPALLPGSTIARLPNEHPVFHCFHQFPNGNPHMQGTPHGLHGLTYNGRVVAMLSPSDLHCGWVDGDAWFGAGMTRQALEMGTNIYLYAMTQRT